MKVEEEISAGDVVMADQPTAVVDNKDSMDFDDDDGALFTLAPHALCIHIAQIYMGIPSRMSILREAQPVAQMRLRRSVPSSISRCATLFPDMGRSLI